MKCYLFGIKYRKYTHLAWFLLSIWLVSSFWGDFEVVVAAFYIGEVKAVFSPKFGFAARFLPQRKERYSICPHFTSTWKKFPPSFPIRTIFAFLMELSILLLTLLSSFRLWHSLMKSQLATAPAWHLRLTRRVGSSGKSQLACWSGY